MDVTLLNLAVGWEPLHQPVLSRQLLQYGACTHPSPTPLPSSARETCPTLCSCLAIVCHGLVTVHVEINPITHRLR